eukprot:m.585323 g.585323  ORF g.585323 m.585323 type:complete len:396 (+) comp57969_c0_seq13:296-1483(+)
MSNFSTSFPVALSSGSVGYGELLANTGQQLTAKFALAEKNRRAVHALLARGSVAVRSDRHRALRETDQFSLQLLFHDHLLSSPQRTLDPEEADLFYVPYYSFFVQRCHQPHSLAASNKLEAELFRILQEDYPFWNRFQGADHFSSLGFIEREHAQNCEWCSGQLLHPLAGRMTFFAIERRAKKDQPAANVIQVPYPSTVHYFTTMTHSKHVNGPLLVSCIADDQGLSLRVLLKEELEANAPETLWITPEYMADNQGLTANMIAVFERSVFCLQPYGDSPTRKSFYDSLLSGCIPVRFERNVKYPFDDFLYNIDDISVFIDEQQLLSGEVQLLPALRSISAARIEQYQMQIKRLSVHLQYAERGRPAAEQDAFQMALRELENKVLSSPKKSKKGPK